MTREADAPVTSVFFLLEIDGAKRAVFSNLSMSSEVELLEGTAGGDEPSLPQTRRIRPTVTLTRRQDDDMQLFAWHQSVVGGAIAAARKNCTLTVFDPSGRPVARYHLDMAWPLKVKVGPLEAGAKEILTEAVTLICDNVRRVAL